MGVGKKCVPVSKSSGQSKNLLIVLAMPEDRPLTSFLRVFTKKGL